MSVVSCFLHCVAVFTHTSRLWCCWDGFLAVHKCSVCFKLLNASNGDSCVGLFVITCWFMFWDDVVQVFDLFYCHTTWCNWQVFFTHKDSNNPCGCASVYACPETTWLSVNVRMPKKHVIAPIRMCKFMGVHILHEKCACSTNMQPIGSSKTANTRASYVFGKPGSHRTNVRQA